MADTKIGKESIFVKKALSLLTMKNIFLILLAAVLACSFRPEGLKTGDLLFCGYPEAQDEGTAAGAIAAAVGNIIHVAILEVDGDAVWVIDATMKRGVDRHPLDTLIADFTKEDGQKPTLVVKRLKEGFSQQFIDRAKTFLGQPYDYYFKAGNGKMYCSELVQECYRSPDGKYLFDSKPMNFKDSSGEYPSYWVDLYKELGEPVPQGEPGTNPQDLSDSPLLEEVHISLIPMSRYPKNQKVRKPAVAGTFYPASAKEVKSMLSPWLHPSADGPAPQAVIVPHAGYVFSGEVAASAFNRIPRGHAYKRIFLIGPSHRVGFPGASVDTLFGFAETPLGKVPIDVSLGQELIRKGFTCLSQAHDREHCLEVQLPFLQMLYADVPPIVPIIIGTERPAVLKQIAGILEPYFTPENLFVISSDFSHYPSYEDAKASDLYLADTITSGGVEEFMKALAYIRKMDFVGEDTAACGACAIEVLLSMMDAQGRNSFAADHVMYRNSGDSPYGDKDRVVGYNAIVFNRLEKQDEHLFHFSEAEKKAMLATARASIFSTLGLEFDGDDTPVGILKEKGYGVFVTLHLNGRLRGCIGRFTSPSTLHSTIREMAQSAAFSDPRFPSLSRSEAPKIDIEISVLSPLKKISSIDEFKLGRDGIYMIKGGHHGTFLPQVAEETGWTTEEFLGHCARDKAGIGYYGWKDADLYTYQTEIVKE